MTIFGIVVAFLAVNHATSLPNPSPQLVTCPGFAGYCSEAYPGDTCTVVCAFGRNNVPLCQPDGTWTDEPRCIEHEPGKPAQRTGWCPGVPGYCSDSPPGTLCQFDCLTGPDISSFCTKDGTWDAYPVCDGDVRETRDGCDGCPGPFGGPRDRKKEAEQGSSSSSSKAAAAPTRSSAAAAPRPKPAARRPASKSQPRSISQPRRPAGNRKNNSAAGRRNNNNNNNNNGGRRNNNNGGRRNNNGGGKRRNNNNKRKKNGNGRRNGNGGGSNNRNRGRSQARNNNNKNKSQQSAGNGSCPESVLEKCIAVCPSFIELFKTCVEGCAKRC